MQMIPFWLQLQGGHMQHGYLWSATFWFLPTQALLLPAHICKHHPRFLWLLHHQDGQWRKPCISASQGLILSKIFESHSNPVPGVSSSLQRKTQIQPAYKLPNSMHAVSRLLAPALRKCLCSKKYQAQRFRCKPVAIPWTATSASLAILTSLIAMESLKETT